MTFIGVIHVSCHALGFWDVVFGGAYQLSDRNVARGGDGGRGRGVLEIGQINVIKCG